MKFYFTVLLLFAGMLAYGQRTIVLSSDLELTETLVISEDTRYEGNGFKINCPGCSPAILVKRGIKAHFEDVLFPKTYARWLRVEGGDMTNVTWNSPKMKGYLRSN